MFKNKTLLVTGGTGSFGKQFIKTILHKCPEVRKIIVLSRDEFKQFEMAHSADFKPFQSQLRFFIGDVRDRERMMRAFDGVDFVVHAAALKQVPACEYNPLEAIKTNIYGAQNVIDCAIDRGVKKVVALSTDKACAPINLYGATKLCSDKLFVSGNVYSGPNRTKFSVVRYGNVVGSRGSVIPFFQRLIRAGATELPITDLRMTRFWLELDQAVTMVLRAFESMHGGEIYVKKIPSMKIIDLAKAMAPHLQVKEVGIRPGEKIHEQMITKEDAPNTLELADCYIILPQVKFFRADYDFPGAKPVAQDFEYHSGKNKVWLTIDAMKAIIAKFQ